MSISSLSSSSTVQHTINNSSTYVYKHFEFILFHLQLYLIHVLTKALSQIRPNLTILWKVYFIQILSIVLANFTYNAGIMLNAIDFLLCSKYLCWHNRLKPTARTIPTIITEALRLVIHVQMYQMNNKVNNGF